MNDSKNRNIECNKLHAYELNILSEEETASFEKHLITCDACFNNFETFQSGIGIIKKSRLSEYKPKSSSKSTSISSIVKRISFAAIFGLLLFPAFIGIKSILVQEQIRPLQTLYLNSTRATSDQILEYDSNLDISVSFYCPGIDRNDIYTIIIYDENLLELYKLNDYNNFDSHFISEILIPSSIIKDGSYRLKILTSDSIELYSFDFKLKEKKK